MDNGFARLLANKTPEERSAILDAITGLSSLDDEDSQLQEQLARANALSADGPHNWGAGAAAPLGALADVLGAGVGAYKSNKIGRQRDDIRAKRKAGRATYADLLFGPGQTYDAADVAPAEDMSMDGIPEFLRKPY